MEARYVEVEDNPAKLAKEAAHNPQSYLKKFANRKGDLYVYEKDKDVRKSSSSREAAERDFFEYETHEKTTNYEFEKWLGKLESASSPVQMKLIQSGNLDNHESAVWALYVASLFLRSRRVRSELTVEVTKSATKDWLQLDHIRDLQLQILKEHGQLYSAQEIRNAGLKNFERYDSPAYRHIEAILNSTPKLAMVLGQKPWSAVKACQGEFFVTCDAPVISFQLRNSQCFPGCGWGHLDAYVALPLSPNVMFVASPPGVAWSGELDHVSTETANRTIIQFANRFVYSYLQSPKISTFLQELAGTIFFGESAFQTR